MKRKNKPIPQSKKVLPPKHKFAPTTVVDIVIPVLNRLDLLAKCLNALPDAFGDVKFSVTIFDNGSENKDDFYKQLAGLNYVLCIFNKENVGFPLACNAGASFGKAPYVFFLNSDVVMLPGSGKSLVNNFIEDEKLGIAGMKLLFSDDSTSGPHGKVQHVGLSCNVSFDIIHHLLGWSSDNPKVTSIRDVMAVTGAAMMIRRSLFEKARGFAEIYGLGCFEDCDMCLTVRGMGYNIIVDQQAVGHHFTGASAKENKIAFPLGRNRDIFMARWKSKLDYTDWRYW